MAWQASINRDSFIHEKKEIKKAFLPIMSFCITTTSKTRQIPITVIPCSFESKAKVAKTRVIKIQRHLKKNQMKKAIIYSQTGCQ